MMIGQEESRASMADAFFEANPNASVRVVVTSNKATKGLRSATTGYLWITNGDGHIIRDARYSQTVGSTANRRRNWTFK